MSTSAGTENYTLAVSDWPEFDQAGWLIATQPRDPLNPLVGYASRWKASTLQLNQSGYSRFLAWHDQTGCFDRAMAPSGRISTEVVTAYWRSLQDAGLAPHTVAGRIQQLGNMLHAIEPGHDWQWVKRGSYRLQSAAKPVHDLTQRMQPAEDVLALGLDMIDAAENDRYRTPTDRATLFRDGLIISLLILTVPRLANLQSIIIGKQLISRGTTWSLSFDPAATKGGMRHEFAVPRQLVTWLERYLQVHRKVLLDCSKKAQPQTDALWISQHGTHMTSSAIALQVKARTAEAFGVPINPHAFRHISATTIATSDAGNAHQISDVLGHTSGRAGEKYYNKAKMIDAGRRHQETIDAWRQLRLDSADTGW